MGNPSNHHRGRLATAITVERVYDPDTTAMVAALRVALGLPHQLPQPAQEHPRATTDTQGLHLRTGEFR
jgi:hypothetical protein